MSDRPETPLTRPLEDEHQRAIDRLNWALWAMRTAREIYDERRAELASIARRYYAANPDLPVPEGKLCMAESPISQSMETADNGNQRLAVVSEFRAMVIELLNSDWPHRPEVDPDTIKRAAALAVHLRNWDSWR